MTIPNKNVDGSNSANNVVLAMDAHGGDFGPAVTIPAALDVLNAQPGLNIL